MPSAMFWGFIAVFVAFAVLLYVLSDMLMPFVAGLAVAYFLDPIADRLEKAGVSRGLATVLILSVFLGLVATLTALLLPLLRDQALALIHSVPGWLAALQAEAAPLIERLQTEAAANGLGDLKAAAGGYAGSVAGWAKQALGGLWAGGVAVFRTLSLVLVMPLVAFYLLRDWDHIIAYIDGLVPARARDAVRVQARGIDETLSGFVRGQALVCLILATIYGGGLTAVGLDFGLLIGMGTGLLAFVPYLGMGLGLVTAFAVAAFQFSDPMSFLLVAAVFAVGQGLEASILTPKLVGGRVGLHPAWVIFALMAGGSLLGFTGVLLAVPTAAVLGVLIRFWIGRYRESRLFGAKV